MATRVHPQSPAAPSGLIPAALCDRSAGRQVRLTAFGNRRIGGVTTLALGPPAHLVRREAREAAAEAAAFQVERQREAGCCGRGTSRGTSLSESQVISAHLRAASI